MRRRSLTVTVVLLSACAAREPLDSTTGRAPATGAPVNGPQGGQAAGSVGAGGSGAGGATVGGDPSPAPGLITLASGQRSPFTLAIDGDSVYWANDGAQDPNDVSVAKVPLGGGAVTALVSGVKAANGIAVDRSRVYFCGLVSDAVQLVSVPLAGGLPSVLATGFTNDPIAVGPRGVYGSGPGRILAAPLAGGAASPVVPDGTLDLSSFATYGIAVDAHSVYWTLFGDPTSVMKAPIEGGPATTLTSAAGPGEGLAVDADFIYFATGQGVMKVPLVGGAPTMLSSSPAAGIAVDAAYVYFTNFYAGPGAVRKVAKSGGATITLATGQLLPWGIAVDATSVYWTDAGNENGATGTIMKLTPK
jgi:hypothetical protein